MKKGEKQKKVSKKPTPVLPPFEFVPPTALELGEKPSVYVKCRICCTALPHLNFEWPAVPTDLSLGLIKNAITKRHSGSLPNLVLYRDKVKPSCSLAEYDDNAKLMDIGIQGAVYGTVAELPSVTLYYDFTAPRSDCPIAFVEPELLPSKFKVPIKEVIRINKLRAV